MYRIDTIPDDIIALLIDRLFQQGDSAHTSFKKNLPLLAICQKWRELALPRVYQYAFISYGQVSNSGMVFCKPNILAEESNDVTVSSNLNLILSAKHVNLVQRLDINVCYMANPLPGMEKVCKVLEVMPRNWSVKSLYMHLNESVVLPQNMQINIVESNVLLISNAITKCMPSIVALEFSANSLSQFTKILFGQIAESYGDTLLKLVADCPISVSDKCLFTKLEYVSINAQNDSTYRIPNICAGTPRTLILVNCSSSHSWSSFKSSKPGILEFAQLNELRVKYNFKASNNQHEETDCLKSKVSRLMFPELKLLNVSCDSSSCPLLEFAEFPHQMDSIYIQAAPAVYYMMRNTILPSAKHISLASSPVKEFNSNALQFMNNILSHALDCNVLRLEIVHTSFTFTDENMHCGQLTEVVINARATVSTMFSLIGRLPNLRNVSFNKLVNNGMEIIYIPEIEEHERHPMPAFNTKLKRIQLQFIHVHKISELLVPAIVYTLLKMPRLQRLTAQQIPKRLLLEQLATYSSVYSHLNNIELKVKGSQW